MNLDTLRKRRDYKAFDDHVIGVRRPPCNDSRVIVEADDSWRLNPRVDVLSVGSGVREDIKPGDVVWVIPKGDHRELNKLEDRQFIQTWERFIHAVVPSEHVEINGRQTAVVELDHVWRFENPDGSEVMGHPGDVRLMDLDTGLMSVMTAEALKEHTGEGSLVC